MATCASSTIKIVAKEKTASPIWTYFGLKAYDDGKPISKDNTICRLCETPVPSKGGSTSNKFSHFKCQLGCWLVKAKPIQQDEVGEPLTPRQKVKCEMKQYEKSSRVDPYSDPLKWWSIHSHSNQYPVLSQLAKKYLCIPASSAASERVFSSSGHIVSKCLKPEKVNMLGFCCQKI